MAFAPICNRTFALHHP